MRFVTDVSVVVDRRPLAQAFRAAGLTVEAIDSVRLTVRSGSDGLAGEGEVALDAWSQERPENIAGAAHVLASRLAGQSVMTEETLDAQLNDASRGAPAEARTVVEMAFLDAIATRRGLPVWRLLQLPEPQEISIVRTVPVGQEPPPAGPLKVKLDGTNDRAALERLTDVRGPIILDVNRGWSAREWASVEPLVTRLAPAVLEDPVSDLRLLPAVRRALPRTAVILDEGIIDISDVDDALPAADGVNVKVTRSGGIIPARGMVERVASVGATTMLGCTVEPPRAIAYAAQLATLCDWVDLDGHLWLAGVQQVSTLRLDSSAPGIPRLIELPD